MATKAPPFQKRITALRDQLARLREGGSNLRFLPPLTEKQLAALEKKLGVELTEEHRAFLLEVTAGEEETGTTPLLPPKQGLAELPRGSKPGEGFPVTNAAAKKILAKLEKAKEGDEPPALEASWDGVLPILDQGDGELDVVVLAGPQRGWVWKGWGAGFTPLGRTFLDVVEEHFEDSVADLAERAQAAAAPPPPADTTEMNLSGQGLGEVPAAVLEAKGLLRLDLSRNPIATLPEGLRETSIEELRLAEMPSLDAAQAVAVAGHMPGLRTLVIKGPVAKGPAGLERLGQLRALRLVKLGLTEVPEGVFSLGALATLSLDQNQLTALPDALGKMPGLEEVILFRNPIPPGEIQKRRAEWPHLTLTI